MTNSDANAAETNRRNRKRKVSADKHQKTPLTDVSAPQTASLNKKRRAFEEYTATTSVTLTSSSSSATRLGVVAEDDRIGGTALTFGSGDTGQLGLGEDVLDRKKPAVVKADQMDEEVVQLCCGGMHTIALTKTGEVFSWGCNDEGGLGRDTPEDEDCFLPGKVCFPDESGSIVAISAGDSHSAALSANGHLFFWGGWRDNSGSMTDPVKAPIRIPTLTRIVKIASGYHHLVMLTDEGNVLTMGCGENGQLGRVAERFATRAGRHWQRALMRPAIVPIKMASRRAEKRDVANNADEAAATGAKTVSSSDLNRSQDAATSKSTSRVTDIWAGGYASVVKLESGAVLGFGLNSSSQLGFRSDAATAEECCVFQPKYLASLTALDPTFVSCGHHHTLILSGKDRRVYACGAKAYGACGGGEADSCGEAVEAPTLVPALQDTSVMAVAAGIYTSYAVTSKDGALWSWGTGTNNSLGHGDEEDHLEPRKVEAKQLETRRVHAVVAGGQHCAVIGVAKEDGEEGKTREHA